MDVAVGSQDAKDLIDTADGVGLSPDEAIYMLEKALTYGTSGLLASKAYMRLAMWYEDLGDANKAIGYYFLSMKAWRAYPYAHYACGKLYYEQKLFAEALDQVRKALEFLLDDWGEGEDFEEAKRLLVLLEALTQNEQTHSSDTLA